MLTKSGWQKGFYSHRVAVPEVRACKRPGCDRMFEAVHYDPKVFCSRACAVTVSNSERGGLSILTRRKIAIAVTGLPGFNKGKILVPRVEGKCPKCGNVFLTQRWKNKQYCSAYCAIRDVGSRPTSPRAARAKAGIRPDIDAELYFFSRWEANYARLLNYQGVRWVFQPRTFQLETQKYTPDFYLPDSDEYIEIKNFLSDYSKKRDEQFRKCFPDIKLRLVLKVDYLKLQARFAPLIKGWEFGTMKDRMRVGTEVVKPGAL